MLWQLYDKNPINRIIPPSLLFADCVAVFEGAFRGEDSTDVDVTGFDFAVVHYGKGRGGS